MKSKRKSQSSQKRLSQSEKPTISEEELDEKVYRVLKLKKKLQILQ